MKPIPKKKAARKIAKAKPVAKDTAKGWACPCCPRVHAPTVTECTCRKEAMGKKFRDEALNHERMKEFLERLKEVEKLRPQPLPMQFPEVPKMIPNPLWPYGEPMCRAYATYGSL